MEDNLFSPDNIKVQMPTKVLAQNEAKIVVVGVGGGGCNMINHMIREGTHKIDLVVANIITPVLLSIKEYFSKLTKKYLILTGIEKKEEKEFLNQIKLDDFILKDIKHRGNWIAYLFEKEI